MLEVPPISDTSLKDEYAATRLRCHATHAMIEFVRFSFIQFMERSLSSLESFTQLLASSTETRSCSLGHLINPFKPSGVKWLPVKVFRAILI